LVQAKPVHILISDFVKIHFHTPRAPLYLVVRLTHALSISPICVTCSTHLIFLELVPNNDSWRAKIAKFPHYVPFTAIFYFLSIVSKYSFSTMFSNIINLWSSFRVTDPYK
jgi:hypothetical protein